MKKNDAGFPDYIELRSKLDLDHNERLRKYIDYMYETYNKLYDATYGMLPEEIKFLKDLQYTLMIFYKDELKNCKGITEINNNILALLMAAVKAYNNRLCLYAGKTLTLNALALRFRQRGIAHPYKEAKKYLL